MGRGMDGAEVEKRAGKMEGGLDFGYLSRGAEFLVTPLYMHTHTQIYIAANIVRISDKFVQSIRSLSYKLNLGLTQCVFSNHNS